MNTRFKLAALAAAMISVPAVAQESEAPPYEQWIGVFGTKYWADSDRDVGVPNEIDKGLGLGIEYGYRFTQSWAARAQFSGIDMKHKTPGGDEYYDHAKELGADVMYFFSEDVMYMFGGFRHQNMDDNYTFADVGVGKHWSFGESARLITELAANYHFDDNFVDYAFKLGIAVPFGASGSKSAATPAPATMAPKDSDRDGVEDGMDKCPMTPMGVRVDATGCAVDSDGDGVLNAADKCPGTPAGTTVDAMGCALKDSDMDGVEDSKDMCADTPKGDKVDAQGCTMFDEEEVSITLRVLFDNNSSVVKQPNDPEIQAFADFMTRYTNTQATIEGHTSAPGNADYNMTLSEARADAFKDVLVQRYGIDPSRLETVGYGETQLLDTSNTAEAHRVNRRISVSVTETVKVPEQR
ncbi:OmpA family protein [Alteromonas sp. CYL-A6]|uniref:OmpA family protein n=1 Tax=Alteromonas nitratireducens TaxID=3390813 RepID=UPI0034BC678D